MILPSLYPDEMLCSLLSRLCRLNGISDFRDVASSCFGSIACSSLIGLRVNVPEFCRRTRGAYGGPASLIHETTSLAARSRLGELQLDTLQSIEDGTLSPLLGDLTFYGSSALNYCPKCVDQDVRLFGVAYWHRVHQLPVVRCCPHHEEWIVRVALRRGLLHHSLPLPGDFYATQSGRTEPVNVPRYWQEVAVAALDILNEKAKAFDIDIVNAAIFENLQERGLLSPPRAIRRKKLEKSLQRELEMALPDAQLEMPTFTRQLFKSLMFPNEGFAFGRLMLIPWLFGSWALFQEKCRWCSIFGEAAHRFVGKANPALTSDGIRARHRSACTDYIREHPECSRLDFTRSQYRSFRWLRLHDCLWLDRILPLPQKKADQLLLF